MRRPLRKGDSHDPRWRRDDTEDMPMKRILAATAVAVSFAAGTFAGGAWWANRSGAVHANSQAANVYTCPMHPDYRGDHPGNCPICGMPLEADRAGAVSGNDATVAALPPGAV